MGHRLRRDAGKFTAIQQRVDRGQDKIHPLGSGGSIECELRASHDDQPGCLDLDAVVLDAIPVRRGRHRQRLPVINAIVVMHPLRQIGSIVGFAPELFGGLDQRPETDLLLLGHLLLQPEGLRGSRKEDGRPFQPAGKFRGGQNFAGHLPQNSNRKWQLDGPQNPVVLRDDPVRREDRTQAGGLRIRVQENEQPSADLEPCRKNRRLPLVQIELRRQDHHRRSIGWNRVGRGQ